MDDDGGSGSGVGQWWMMTVMTTATVAVDDHGGAPPSPPAVSARRRVASLSLPALLMAFGLPLLASSQSNTATTADAQSSSDCPPHGGRIQRHCRDSNDRNDVDVGVNCRTIVGEMTR